MHVSTSALNMHNIKAIKQGVQVAEGTVITAYQKGDLSLQNNQGQVLNLSGVLSIPTFATKNVISSTKLVERSPSYTVIIKQNMVKIINGKQELRMQHSNAENLWYFVGKRLAPL